MPSPLILSGAWFALLPWLAGGLLLLGLLGLALRRRQLHARPSATLTGKEQQVDGAEEDELDILFRSVQALEVQRSHYDYLREEAKVEVDRAVETRTYELQRAKETAEQAARVKSQFLANISNELRTPLQGILRFADLGRESAADADRDTIRSYFDGVHESGARLLHMLGDLLDLSKLESGRGGFQFETQQIGDVIKGVMQEFEPLLAERKLALNLVSIEDAAVSIDRRRISQVARNILHNAIKFSPPGGEIAIRIRHIDGAAAVEVRDEGPGIPCEDLDEIFEKFAQATNVDPNAGGTGLGLSISREIILAHSGEIVAYNHPKGGAVFIFSLPISRLLSLGREHPKETVSVD